jgi:hypothetical protein
VDVDAHVVIVERAASGANADDLDPVTVDGRDLDVAADVVNTNPLAGRQ